MRILMKRFLISISILLISICPIFAQSEEEPAAPAENFSYAQNDKGDQFIKIGVMPNFPLNFEDKLYIGGAVQLGYYRFLNTWFAVGGELMAGYNLTLGSNIFTFVPITGGVMFQPSIWKFEFPVTLSTGMTFRTYNNKKRFPDPVFKAEAGAFFRIAESWSFGLSGEFLYLPEWWYKDTSNNMIFQNENGLFVQATISARYHF